MFNSVENRLLLGSVHFASLRCRQTIPLLSVEKPTPAFGEALRQQVEERLAFFESGAPPTKNVDAIRKVLDQMALDGDDDDDDEEEPALPLIEATPKKDKKKKRKAEDDAMDVDEEDGTPEKKKRKLSKEEKKKERKEKKKEKKEKAAAEVSYRISL